MRWVHLIALGAGLLAGCAHDKPSGNGNAAVPSRTQGVSVAGGTNHSGLIVTPGGPLKGRIASVNAAARFVVLSFPLGALPAVEKRLNVYRGGLKVGELKVTGPQRDYNTVADIVTGECLAGDEVRDD